MAGERIATIQRHLLPCSDSQFKLQLYKTSGSLISTDLGSSQFQYTLDTSLFSYQQRVFFEENGYIVIPKLIEDFLLDECCDRFKDLCEGRIDRGNITMMKDLSLMKKGAQGEFLYNKLQDIAFDEVLSKYILHDKMLDYVESFTGPNIMAMHTMLINKPPDSGALTSRHPLHQDLHYFPFRPANRIVASWTAMERVTLDNGCLFVLPGSHRKGILYQHEYPQWEGGVNSMYHGVQGFDDVPKVMLPMEKGDTVFFHPLLLHGSGTNITKGFRKAISCHYAASECEYIDVKGTSQENIALEVEQIMKKRGLTDSTFTDAWRYRSRLARGNQINL